MNKPVIRYLLKIVAVAVVYYACARLGLLMAISNTNASPVWPPSGFAFALVLLFGTSLWPGILAGALFANIDVFSTYNAGDPTTIILMSVFIAIGNTLEAIAGYHLLKFFRSSKPMESAKNFAQFIGVTLVVCTISCSVGLASMYLGNVIGTADFKTVWFTWWMGDVSGIIVLTPVLLVLFKKHLFQWRPTLSECIHLFLLFSILAVYLGVVFSDWFSIGPQKTKVYIVFIFLVWCVFFISQWQSSLVVLLISVFSIWNTLQGYGPFIESSQNDSLMSLQIFLCVIAITMMFLSTTLMERRKWEDYLKKANDALDITKEQLEKSMKEKERFLANMSHEIRTPMNAIVGFTDPLTKTELTEEQKKYTKAVKTSGETLLVIIDDILDFSKIGSGKIVFEHIPFHLSSVVKNIYDLMHPKAADKNVALIMDIHKNVPDCLVCDPTRLNQILMNLVSNAVKFTEEGEVKIQGQLLSETEDSAEIKFTVTDTGIGIAEEKLSTIFEGFTQANNETTRKYGGSGLGLTISRDLVQWQGGTISVKSKINSGSQFSFILKFDKGLSPEIKDEVSPQEMSVKEMREFHVLLVEDNILNQVLSEKVLTDWNCKVDIAENGLVAVEKVISNNYDFVLMDIQLPEMDGYEATRYIRTKLSYPKSEIPIIALTAHALSGEAEKCYAAGMNGYVSKPFNRKTLYSKILTVMKKTSA